MNKMNKTNISDIRDLVKKELIKTKEEINRGILEAILELKNLITIEEGTGRIFILNKEKLKNRDKVILVMAGKYVAYLAEIINSPEAEIQTISEELGIVKTTLSAPLGEIVQKNILLKKETKYRFNEAFIKEEVKKILEKIKNE